MPGFAVRFSLSGGSDEINPYDHTVCTLRGLDSDYSPNSPAPGSGEEYVDELVYEVHQSSSLLGVNETFLKPFTGSMLNFPES